MTIKLIWILCVITIMHICDSRLVIGDDLDDSVFNKSYFNGSDVIDNKEKKPPEIYKDIFGQPQEEKPSSELKNREEIYEEIFGPLPEKNPPQLENKKDNFKYIFGPPPIEKKLPELKIDENIIKEIFGTPPTEKTLHSELKNREDTNETIPPAEKTIPSGFKIREDVTFGPPPVNYTFKNDPEPMDNFNKDNAVDYSYEDIFSGEVIEAIFGATSDGFVLDHDDPFDFDINKTVVVSATQKDDVDLKIDVKHAPKWVKDAIVFTRAIVILLSSDNVKPNATKYVMDNSTSTIDLTTVSDDNAVLNSKTDEGEEAGVWKDVVVMIAGLIFGSLVLLYVAYRLRECVQRDYYLPDPHLENSSEQV